MDESGSVPSFIQLSVTFDKLFSGAIRSTFYHLGKDHYSKFTKVALFVVLGLLPILIFVVGSMVELILGANLDIDEETAKTMQQAPKVVQQ